VRRQCLVRQGKVVKFHSRHGIPRNHKVILVKRRTVTWQVVWLPYFGATIFRVIKDGKVTWKFPQAEWYGDLLKVKKKKQSAQSSDAAHLAAMESTLLGRLHPLVAHCCSTKYDDGDPRLPGWFTVKTMGSAWVVEVKDADTCMRLVVVQQTVDEALTLASLLLESEEAPWEPDQWLVAAKAKKGKK